MSLCKNYDIAIVGGGFTAANLAMHISKYKLSAENVAIIHKENPFGLGVAYSTNKVEHLLNVPASKMSAFEEEPNNFVKWLSSKHPNKEMDTLEYYFAPRMKYAEYIHALSEKYVTTSKRFHFFNNEAIDIEFNEKDTAIYLNNDQAITAQKVIFALGNPLPQPFNLSTDNPVRIIQNPWNNPLVNQIRPQDTVTIIGSGLTMVDVVLSLKANKHNNKINVISRHGLLPQAHSETLSEPVSLLNDFIPLLKVLKMLKGVPDLNNTWRKYIDGLRPITQDLWQNFAPHEKKQFLRHLRAYWDVHRHRIAYHVHKAINNYISDGTLLVTAGRIDSIESVQNKLITSYHHKNIHSELMSDWVINCTGPSFIKHAYQNKLINNMMTKHNVKLDELKLGLSIDKNNNLMHENGTYKHWYALGPICKGTLWEIIAVPDIRKQTLALVKNLCAYPF